MAAEGTSSVEAAPPAHPAAFAFEGKLVLIIDDVPIVLEGTGGLLRQWGYSVVTASSDDAALFHLAERALRPDLIISDYHLANGKTGIETVERIGFMFDTSIPAILISGDTAPEPLQDATASGHHLLHKPVQPMKLRTLLNQVLKNRTARDRLAAV